jgi:hypothetical protein
MLKPATQGPAQTGNWLKNQKAGIQARNKMSGGMADAAVITSGIGNMLGDIGTILDVYEKKKAMNSLAAMSPDDPKYRETFIKVMGDVGGAQGIEYALTSLKATDANKARLEAETLKQKQAQSNFNTEQDVKMATSANVRPANIEPNPAQGPTPTGETLGETLPPQVEEGAFQVRQGGPAYVKNQGGTKDVSKDIVTIDLKYPKYEGQPLKKGDKVVDFSDPTMPYKDEYKTLGKRIVSEKPTDKIKPDVFTTKVQQKSAEQYVKLQDDSRELSNQKDLLNDAFSSFVNYSTGSKLGTGWAATGFGITKRFDKNLEVLDNKFKKINIKEMVQTFKGLSRSIDTRPERTAWDATQPSIKNDDSVNAEIILGARSLALKTGEEAKARMKWMETYKTIEGYESPVIGKMTTVVSPDGDMQLVNKSERKDYVAKGYVGLDEYVKMGLWKNVGTSVDQTQSTSGGAMKGFLQRHGNKE